MAAAALAAGLEVVRPGHTTQLHRLPHVAGHELLNLMHLLLSLEKAPGHVVAEQGVAFPFEVGDVSRFQSQALLLPPMQGVAFLRHGLVEEPGGIVRQKGLDLLPEGDNVRIGSQDPA